MENLNDVLNHIEASAPCSLFGVAAWVETQLDIPLSGFIHALDTLVVKGLIVVAIDDSGLIIDLV